MINHVLTSSINIKRRMKSLKAQTKPLVRGLVIAEKARVKHGTR
jgi:hypothetical protein